MEKRIRKYIDSIKRDFDNLEYKEVIVPEGKKIELRINKFSMSKVVRENDDYDSAVKRLFEDFITNTAVFYSRNFWRL